MANTDDITREWTVMVYMAAGDSHQLDTAAVRDVKEMERGANENVNVVVRINPSLAQVGSTLRDSERRQPLQGSAQRRDRYGGEPSTATSRRTT
jgi:hypothetical protein